MSVMEMGGRLWADRGEVAREIGLSLCAIGGKSVEYVNDEGLSVINIEMRGGVEVSATYQDQDFTGQPLTASLEFRVGEHTYPIGTHVGDCAGLTAKLAKISIPANARRHMVATENHEGFSALKSTVGAR
jgi:hypothetical protein